MYKMTEMDDELQRLLKASSSPEQAYEQEQAELRAEQKKARRKKFQKPLTYAGVLLTTAAVSFGVYKFTKAILDTDPLSRQDRLALGLDPAFYKVEGLRQHGACADELKAEAKWQAFKSRQDGVSDHWQREYGAAAGRLDRSASLAAANNVSCFPAQPTAMDLTPGFDVATMRRHHICADEILANRSDPDQAVNNLYRERQQIENRSLQLAAEIATKHSVAC